jgi:hypothetical protein
MELTGKEKFQVQYLLPFQGSLLSLERADKILKKIDVKAEDAESEEIYEIEFTAEEIQFISEMIAILDQAQKLNLQMLPLIRKILLRSNNNG